MDHVGLFSAKLILTPLLLCIYLNKYDLGRARAKKKKKYMAFLMCEILVVILETARMGRCIVSLVAFVKIFLHCAF